MHRRNNVGCYPTKWLRADDRDSASWPRRATEVTRDRCRSMATAQCCDIGGLGSVHDITRRKNAFTARVKVCVDARSASMRVNLNRTAEREFVVRNPIGGEYDGVAFDTPRLAGVEVPKVDAFDPASAVDCYDRSSRPDWGSVSDRCANAEYSKRLMTWELCDHSDRTSTGVGKRHDRGEADVFGADYHCPFPGLTAVEVDHLLKHSCRHHAIGTVAGDKTRSTGSLAAARGKEHGAWSADFSPFGTRGLDGAVFGNGGHHRLSA